VILPENDNDDHDAEFGAESAHLRTTRYTAQNLHDWPNSSKIDFTALHEMQARSSDENSICRSVRLSNAGIVTKRKKDLSRFFIPYERSLSLVF